MDKLKEFTVSTARPLPVIVLADISGSMSVDGKIQALNQALREMLDTCTRGIVARAYALRAMHGTPRNKGERASSRMLDTCTRGIVARAYALRAMHGTPRNKGKRASSRAGSVLRTTHAPRQTRGELSGRILVANWNLAG